MASDKAHSATNIPSVQSIALTEETRKSKDAWNNFDAYRIEHQTNSHSPSKSSKPRRPDPINTGHGHSRRPSGEHWSTSRSDASPRDQSRSIDRYRSSEGYRDGRWESERDGRKRDDEYDRDYRRGSGATSSAVGMRTPQTPGITGGQLMQSPASTSSFQPFSIGSSSAHPGPAPYPPPPPLPIAVAPLPVPPLKDDLSPSPVIEAVHAYDKYIQAKERLAAATKQREKHAPHFSTFPAMRDRYDKELQQAKQGHKEAESRWASAKQASEEHLTGLAKQESAKNLLSLFTGQGARLSGLKKWIKDIIEEESAQKNQSASNAEVTALRQELEELRLESAKKDTVMKHITSIVTKMKNTHDQDMKSLDELRKDVMEAQELSVAVSGECKSSIDQGLEKTNEDIKKLEERVEQYQKDVEKSVARIRNTTPDKTVLDPTKAEITSLQSQMKTIQTTVDKSKKEISEIKTGFQTSLEALEHKLENHIPSMDMVPASMDHGAPNLEDQDHDYVTKSELNIAFSRYTSDVYVSKALLEEKTQEITQSLAETYVSKDELYQSHEDLKEHIKSEINPGQIHTTVEELRSYVNDCVQLVGDDTEARMQEVENRFNELQVSISSAAGPAAAPEPKELETPPYDARAEITNLWTQVSACTTKVSQLQTQSDLHARHLTSLETTKQKTIQQETILKKCEQVAQEALRYAQTAFNGLHQIRQEFQPAMATVNSVLDLARKVDALNFSVRAVQDQQESWSTKEFYERLVQQLKQSTNGNIIASQQQLDQAVKDVERMKTALQSMLQLSKRITEVEAGLRDVKAQTASSFTTTTASSDADKPNGHPSHSKPKSRSSTPAANGSTTSAQVIDPIPAIRNLENELLSLQKRAKEFDNVGQEVMALVENVARLNKVAPDMYQFRDEIRTKLGNLLQHVANNNNNNAATAAAAAAGTAGSPTPQARGQTQGRAAGGNGDDTNGTGGGGQQPTGASAAQ